MEKIYLAIIILYIAYKIIPPVLSGYKLYLKLGYKRIYIKNILFVMRKLSPLDFIEEDQGFFMSFMQLAKGKTMWDQMRENKPKEFTDKEIAERLDMAKRFCEKGIVYWPNNLKASDFFSTKASAEITKMAWTLYAHLITHNFPSFRKCYELNSNYVIHVAELCSKFGKKPHDHIKGGKGLSELEAYMIDEFFFNQLTIKENSFIQKQNDAMKKRK